MSEHEQEQVDETRFDVGALRRMALDATRDWMLVEDVQGEVVAGRERAGIERPHVPVQIVVQVLDALVEDGRLERQEGDLAAGAFLPRDGGELVRYRRKPEDRGETVRRRAALLRHLFPPPRKVDEAPVPVHALTAGQLVAALATESIPSTERVVLEDLASLGNDVGAEDVDGEAVFALREKAAAEILASGAVAVAARTWPEEGDEPATGAVFQQQVTEELSAARAARARAELERDKLGAFLTEHGQNVDDILGRKPVALRKEFIWTQTRPVDLAEQGVIYKERRVLQAKVDLVKMELDGAKADFKAKLLALDEQLKALDAAAECNSRVVSVRAYSETDWEAGVTITRAVEDDRELERKPIAPGTQKVIPGTEAPVKADAAPADAPPAEGAETAASDELPPLIDVRQAILDSLRAMSGPATHEELNAAIGPRFVCPEGFETLVKIEIAKSVIAGVIRIVQGHKPPKYALPTEPKAEKKAAPAPRAEESDDDEDDDLDDDVGLEGDDDGADVQHEEGEDDAQPPPAVKKGRRKKNPRTGQVSP